MNHRTDKFGGSLENRVRFARMLTRAIRKAVPIWSSTGCRPSSPPQRGKGGIDEADAVQFAQWLVEDGVICSTLRRPTTPATQPIPFLPWAYSPTASSSKSPGTSKGPSMCWSKPWVVSWMPKNGCACHRERHGRHGCHGRPLLADPDWAPRSPPEGLAISAAASAATRAAPMPSMNRQFLSCVPNAENGLREHLQHPARSAEKEDQPSSAAAPSV